MRRKLIEFIVGSWEFIDHKLRTTNHELRTIKRSSGFTLTEVVVASGLLIIAMVPMLRALTSSHLNTVTIQHKTRSLTLAQAKLDEIRAQSIYHYTDSFTEVNTSLDGSYLCNVADVPVSGNLRTITVSVGYDLDGNNILQPGEIEVILTTFVAKRWQ